MGRDGKGCEGDGTGRSRLTFEKVDSPESGRSEMRLVDGH